MKVSVFKRESSDPFAIYLMVAAFESKDDLQATLVSPVELAKNDRLWLAIVHADGLRGGFAPPSGFALREQIQRKSSATSDIRVEVYERTVDGSELASYDVARSVKAAAVADTGKVG